STSSAALRARLRAREPVRRADERAERAERAAWVTVPAAACAASLALAAVSSESAICDVSWFDASPHNAAAGATVPRCMPRRLALDQKETPRFAGDANRGG